MPDSCDAANTWRHACVAQLEAKIQRRFIDCTQFQFISEDIYHKPLINCANQRATLAIAADTLGINVWPGDEKVGRHFLFRQRHKERDTKISQETPKCAEKVYLLYDKRRHILAITFYSFCILLSFHLFSRLFSYHLSFCPYQVETVAHTITIGTPPPTSELTHTTVYSPSGRRLFL